MTKAFWFLLILGVIPVVAAESGTNAAPAMTAPADSDDLSVYTTADSLWAHADAEMKTLGQLIHEQGAGPATAGVEAQAKATLEAFVARYPADERRWQAKLAILNIDFINAPEGAPSPALVQEMDAFTRDKSVPVGMRAEVASMEVGGAIVKAQKLPLNDPAGWPAVEARIAAFQKEYGLNFSSDGEQPVVVMLRYAELQDMKSSGDQKRYLALLNQLTTDPQPTVAEMAQHVLAAEKMEASLKGKPLELKYTAVDGTAVDLAKLRGKVVLIDFWATWCGPCVAEVPEVVATYQKYHGQGFDIVGVSLDQDKAALEAFTKQHGMTWPQFFDGGGFDNAISKKFGIDAIPAMWLVDQKGMLVSTDAREDLAGQVEKLLKSPTQP
jgi:thiol-disulfide isomerase/thioredoxin